MHIADPLSDMITRIRNAQMRKKTTVVTPGSKLRESVLVVLKEEGYIRDYSVVKYKDGRMEFNIELKYFDGMPVIKTIERVSRSGRRVYSRVSNIGKVASGLGVTIISTSKGVMADYQAQSANLGGEILCKVF